MSALSIKPIAALLVLALSVVGSVAGADLSPSARSRLLLDKGDAPPDVTPSVWDRPEDYSSPADLAAEVPQAMFDLLGFVPQRLTPVPPVTPRIQGMSHNLVTPGSVPAGLSFARRVTQDGTCRVYVARETALALDDTTFVQWHERAHCDRGYNDRELEESKANIQGFLMMAKTGDVWYAWQSIDGRGRTLDRTEPFWAPYKLGYRVGLGTLLPLFKKRGGPKKEFGYDVVEILKTMSERQVNALSMLLVEDARRKLGDFYGAAHPMDVLVKPGPPGPLPGAVPAAAGAPTGLPAAGDPTLPAPPKSLLPGSVNPLNDGGKAGGAMLQPEPGQLQKYPRL